MARTCRHFYDHLFVQFEVSTRQGHFLPTLSIARESLGAHPSWGEMATHIVMFGVDGYPMMLSNWLLGAVVWFLIGQELACTCLHVSVKNEVLGSGRFRGSPRLPF